MDRLCVPFVCVTFRSTLTVQRWLKLRRRTATSARKSPPQTRFAYVNGEPEPGNRKASKSGDHRQMRVYPIYPKTRLPPNINDRLAHESGCPVGFPRLASFQYPPHPGATSMTTMASRRVRPCISSISESTTTDRNRQHRHRRRRLALAGSTAAARSYATAPGYWKCSGIPNRATVTSMRN